MEQVIDPQQSVQFQQQQAYDQQMLYYQQQQQFQQQQGVNYDQQNLVFLTNQQYFMEPEKKKAEKKPTIEDKVVELQKDIIKLQEENDDLNVQFKEAMNDFKSIQSFVNLKDKKADLKFFSELLAKTRREFSIQKFEFLQNEVNQATKEFKDISQVNNKLQQEIWMNAQKLQQLQYSNKMQQINYLQDQINQYEKYYNDLKTQEQQLYERSMYIITCETLHSLNDISTKINPLKKRLAYLQKQKTEQKTVLSKLRKNKEDQKKMQEYKTQQAAREREARTAKQEQYNKILGKSNNDKSLPKSPRRLAIEPINPALYT